jgi:quercetin dioxygenase-like cupin family protein
MKGKSMTYFCDVENRATKQLAPGVTARTFWQNQMLLSLVDFEPNTLVPLHTHPHEQSGVVLEGEVEMTIDGESRIIRPGDMYIIPGGIEHSAKSFGAPARVLDTFSPVREEYKY